MNIKWTRVTVLNFQMHNENKQIQIVGLEFFTKIVFLLFQRW